MREKEIMLRRDKMGFTLLELIIAIIIIGVLASLAIPRYQKTMEEAKRAECWAIAGMVRRQALFYNLQTGTWPPDCWNDSTDPAANCDNLLNLDIYTGSREHYNRVNIFGCPGGYCGGWWNLPFGNPPAVAAIYYDDTKGMRHHCFIRLDNGQRGYAEPVIANQDGEFILVN